MRKNTYSVSQVNAYIKNMFAQDFMLRSICIKGEISNCKYHSTGHTYFTVKDEKAAIPAVMFLGNRKGLGFRMKDGDKVLITGSIEVYERDGKYQLYAREIQKDGEGDLFLKYEALKKTLEEMGMFAREYKKAIPKYIKTLGIVTASTGAAIQDIRNIAGRRNPYVQLILYPAKVQGEGAAESIVNGIRALEDRQVDVIIVGRGGGSIEDLWAFNEEIVARAIFECEIPVISAVGHETDDTIADFVSDLRAPTPSAAAELAVYDVQELMYDMQALERRLNFLMKQKQELTRSRYLGYFNRLQLKSPKNQLNSERQYAAGLEERLYQKMKEKLTESRHRLRMLSERIDGVSPAKKLSQGLAFVVDGSGKRISDIQSVRKGDTMQVHLQDGRIMAEVTAVIPDKNNKKKGSRDGRETDS